MTARKATRARKATQKTSYIEPEYDSDYDPLPAKNPRPSRYSARLQAAFDDNSTTEEISPAEDVELPVVRRASRPRPTKRKTRSATASTNENHFRGFKRVKVSHTSYKVQTTAKPVKSATKRFVSSRGRKQPWQTLPYQILLKIMKYAADASDTGATAWLLSVSTLSQSFHEASLGALLFSPPLLPAYRAHGLVRLLKISEEEFGSDLSHPKQLRSSIISMDYRTKIQHLYIEAKALLTSKSGIQLADILHNTPVLKSLQFYHHLDSLSSRIVWAQASQSRGKNKWQYTQLYPALDSLPYHLNLQHFEWNARFLTKDDGLLIKFNKVNKTTSHFHGLKSLTLRNFVLDDAEELLETVTGSSLINGPDAIPNVHQARLITWRLSLKEAWSYAKNLRALSIHDSNIFDPASMAILPAGLTKLDIVNCPLVNTEGMESFLASKGHHLKELILRGNQYMSIDFMRELKKHTPVLAVLEVDLTYHDPTSFQDTEPLYDSLLPEGSPTWPTSLERISIGPLRKLSSKDAEGFYQSLVDAAPNLPYLRVLEIRTLLNEAGWRDRAALRMKWSATFDEVFNVKRNPRIRSPAPITSLPRSKVDVAFHAKTSSLDSNGNANAGPKVQELKDTGDASNLRKSRRIQDLASIDSQAQLSDSATDPPSPTYSSLLESFNGTDSAPSAVEEDEEADSSSICRGRCHTVVFELSDQRPAQDQFKENDFLD